MSAEPAFDKARAGHPFDVSLLMARCVLCGVPAAHEVVECMAIARHPQRAYLCCEHFKWILQDCSIEANYTMPEPRGPDT